MGMSREVLCKKTSFRIAETWFSASLPPSQLCDLDRPLPFSKTLHFHHQANYAYSETVAEKKVRLDSWSALNQSCLCCFPVPHKQRLSRLLEYM